MGPAEPSRSAEAAVRVPGESPRESASLLLPPEAPVTGESLAALPSLKGARGEAVFSPPVLDREISSVIEVSVPAGGGKGLNPPGIWEIEPEPALV